MTTEREQPISYAALREFFEQVGAAFGVVDPSMILTYSDCVTVVTVANEEKLIRWTPSGWTVETVEES